MADHDLRAVTRGAVYVLLVLAACERSEPLAPAPGSGSAIVTPKPVAVDAAPVRPPADAAAPVDAGRKQLPEPPELVGKACFPPGFTGAFSRVEVIDTFVRICMTTQVDADSEIEHCIDVDLATGKPHPVGIAVSALVSMASADGRYVVDVQDATHVIVSTTGTPRAHVATIEVPANGGEIEDARFVDNTIYVSVDAPAEPRAFALLYKPTGERLAALPADANVMFGVPREYADERWAVPTLGGDSLVRFDSATGAILPAPPAPVVRFSLCNGCSWHANEPSAASLLDVTGNGGLLEVSDDGRIKWIDGASGKLTKTVPLPLCK